MTTLLTARSNLLAAWHSSRSADLRSHLEHHGPLPMPAARDEAWAVRLAQMLGDSGLVGRGGASFPSASKLAHLRSQGGAATLVVNAMEGEPASMKDRVLLSFAPHLVIDGAQLVALAVRAARIVICVPEETQDAARVISKALTERSRTNLSPITVEVVLAPGRYIGGEESAIVSWLDGGTGLPSFRPDKSRPLRIGRSNALVHNAETLAHVALIARHGPAWFRDSGHEGAAGTCLVTVSGTVEHQGVYEVAFGSPISAIVEQAMPSRPPAAVLVGGYGGSWIAGEELETPYSPERLARYGAIVGPGVLVSIDDSVCGIAETARIARYMAAEGAGQCGPCVFGLPAIADDLAAVAAGRVDPQLARRLLTRLGAVEGRGACRHPDGVVRMARSALSVFGEDLERHLAGAPCASRTRPTVLRFRDPVSER